MSEKKAIEEAAQAARKKIEETRDRYPHPSRATVARKLTAEELAARPWTAEQYDAVRARLGRYFVRGSFHDPSAGAISEQRAGTSPELFEAWAWPLLIKATVEAVDAGRLPKAMGARVLGTATQLGSAFAAELLAAELQDAPAETSAAERSAAIPWVGVSPGRPGEEIAALMGAVMMGKTPACHLDGSDPNAIEPVDIAEALEARAALELCDASTIEDFSKRQARLRELVGVFGDDCVDRYLMTWAFPVCPNHANSARRGLSCDCEHDPLRFRAPPQ